MIRHKNLYETYSADIGNVVDNKLLEEDNPLYPFDIISGELSKINPKIHRIIKNLKSPSLDEILSVHKDLRPAERAVDILIEKKIDIDSYKRAGAKVVYAGDKLDIAVEKEIEYISDKIKSSMTLIDEKGTNDSIENIKKERAKIMRSIDEISKAKEVYLSRGLDPENPNLISSSINNYRNKRIKSADTQKRISSDLDYYKSLHNISNYKFVLETLIFKSKSGLLKGEYVKISKENEDYETLIFLKEWYDEIKSIRKDNSIIDKKKDLISKIKETKNYISKINDVSIEELKKISKNESISYNYKIFMGEEIKEYNNLLTELKDKLKKKQDEEFKTNYNKKTRRIKKGKSLSVDKKLLPDNEGDYIILSEELENLQKPADTRYHVIDDVLQLRVPANGWVERMNLLSKEVNKLSSQKDLLSSDYPLRVYETLEKFYNNGYLGHIAGLNEKNRQIIDSSMQRLYLFATKFTAQA